MLLLNLIKKILQPKLTFLYAVVSTNDWLAYVYSTCGTGIYLPYCFLALKQAHKI